MKLLLTPRQINRCGIFFGERKANMIMDGKFSKIIYSDAHLSLNGLFFVFPLKIKQIIKSNLYFDSRVNSDIFNTLFKLEQQLLDDYSKHFGLHGKSKQLAFNTIHSIGNVRFYKERTFNHYAESKPFTTGYDLQKYYIKISGIWESSHQYGITYKIIEY